MSTTSRAAGRASRSPVDEAGRRDDRAAAAASAGAPSSRDDFFQLTPERVLDAVEKAGLQCRPLCYPLNSFENRVYEVELADKSRIVAKFYRPGRWTREQIAEEHELLAALAAEELPVCAWRPFPGGDTLHAIDRIFYSVADRRAGRAPDEVGDALALRLGMFVGRMHAVAARRPFGHRPRLDADSYVRTETEFLRAERQIAGAFEARYLRAAEELADLADAAWPRHDQIRLHADLHLGNVLLRDDQIRVLDFDDAVMGPAVQDLWLAIPGRDEHARRLRALCVEGYERFRLFDHGSLRLIELLRGLRMVRYCAWLARRYDDPAFRLGWPEFGSEEYWRTTTDDIEEQLRVVRGEARAAREAGDAARGMAPAVASGAAAAEEVELTNKDYFWDWEGD
jgi:Ser/Thr protein kinase RdoA (MazF antagonist)